ncbi:hypothetical protein AAMO2058_001476900 [Amorphochlora amoebiformis]
MDDRWWRVVALLLVLAPQGDNADRILLRLDSWKMRFRDGSSCVGKIGGGDTPPAPPGLYIPPKPIYPMDTPPQSTPPQALPGAPRAPPGFARGEGGSGTRGGQDGGGFGIVELLKLKESKKHVISNQEERLLPGDWSCTYCNEINFEFNEKCSQCDRRRLGRPTGVAPSLLSDEQKGAEPKKGDWKCLRCNYLNFARRDTCNICGGTNPVIQMKLKEPKARRASDPSNEHDRVIIDYANDDDFFNPNSKQKQGKRTGKGGGFDDREKSGEEEDRMRAKRARQNQDDSKSLSEESEDLRDVTQNENPEMLKQRLHSHVLEMVKSVGGLRYTKPEEYRGTKEKEPLHSGSEFDVPRSEIWMDPN